MQLVLLFCHLYDLFCVSSVQRKVCDIIIVGDDELLGRTPLTADILNPHHLARRRACV